MHEEFKTTCCYCGVGCGITVQKDRNGRLQVEGDKDHPVNKGMLCSKGMNLHYTAMDTSDRLLYPEMPFSHLKLNIWGSLASDVIKVMVSFRLLASTQVPLRARKVDASSGDMS